MTSIEPVLLDAFSPRLQSHLENASHPRDHGRR